jgi:hypothetical protein
MKRFATHNKTALTIGVGMIVVASLASTVTAVPLIDVLWHEDFNYPNAAPWSGDGPWTALAQLSEPWYTKLTSPPYSLPPASLQAPGTVSLNAGSVFLNDGMIGASVTFPNTTPTAPAKSYRIAFGGDISNTLRVFAHTQDGSWLFSSAWPYATEWIPQEITQDPAGTTTSPITLDIWLWNTSGTTQVDWVEFRANYEGEAPTVVPAPGAALLCMIGAGLAARMRRRGAR